MFFGSPKFLDLTFNVPTISHHLAKFQSRELGDLGPKFKKKQLHLKLFWGNATNFGTYINCSSAHISDHASKFHGNRSRQLGDIAPRSGRKKISAVKHKTIGLYRELAYRSDRPKWVSLVDHGRARLETPLKTLLPELVEYV